MGNYQISPKTSGGSFIFEVQYCTYLGGGGGKWDLAKPTHATMPTARIIHPNTSYLRSLLFFFFDV